MSIEEAPIQITEDEVIYVERITNIKLPEQYRSFIIKHNGIKPIPNRFITQDRKVESMISRFLPIANIEDDNLLEEIEGITHAGLIPNNLIPIANDPADNRLVISLAASDYGKIYYWSWDEEPQKNHQPSYKYMRLVSNSFNELLEILY